MSQLLEQSFQQADLSLTLEPLLRARAIENQVYVLAAGQVGSHPPTKRVSYGKACIIDPWGAVVAQCNDDVVSHEQIDENDDAGSYCMAK